MAQQTEALCLLQNGALYLSRVGLQPEDREAIFAGFKTGAFSLYFGDEPIYHFDLDGRWQRAFIDGVHYLKGLDTHVQAIERVREGENLVLHRRTLPAVEVLELDALIRSVALDLLSATAARYSRLDPPAAVRPLGERELTEFLERIARWDELAWSRQSELFASLYTSARIPFPEAAQSVLLQPPVLAPAGKAGGPRDFDESAVEEHVRRVAELWGRRLIQAKTLLLVGADLWRRPAEAVRAVCAAAARVFPLRDPAPAAEAEPGHRLEGILGHLDDFGMGLPDAAAWRDLAQHSLARMIFSVISSDPRVRELHGSTWIDDALREAVASVTHAGIAVSLVFWVGSGGREGVESELEQTRGLVASLELPRGTLIYLVDCLEAGGDFARATFESRGLTPVGGAEYESLVSRHRTGLASARTERGLKIAPYSLEKQGPSR